MTKHARLSPSNHRWPHCPGSVREEAKYPDTTNKYSIDGTGTHVLVELMISDKIKRCVSGYLESTSATVFIGETIGEEHEDKPEGWLVTEDRHNRARVVIDYMEGRGYFTSDYHIETELKVVLGEDWYGTTDILVYKHTYEERSNKSCNDLIEMEIIDFKDGNTYVSEKNNSQLISYAAGSKYKIVPYSLYQGFLCPDLEPIIALNHPDPKNPVRMTIIQPKTSPQVRTQTVTFEELEKERAKLEVAADKTRDPKAPLIPDEENGNGYCKWCKHRNNCVELNKIKKRSLTMIKEITVDNTIDVLSGDLKNIPSEKLAKVLSSKETYDEFFGKVSTEIESRIINGSDVPGYALVPKRTITQWGEDTDVVGRMLKRKGFKTEEIYTKKLITPSKVLASNKLTDSQKDRITNKYTVTKSNGKVLKSVQSKLKTFVDDMKKTVLQSNTVNKKKISFL